MTENEFEKRLAAEQEAGFKARMEDEPAPGMLPDGTLNAVSADAPPFDPQITLSDEVEAEAEEAVGETPDRTVEAEIDEDDLEDLSDVGE